MSTKQSNVFPKGFLWGASTSAHQVEGGLHNQWTVWELENAKSRTAQAEYHYGDLPSWDWVKPEATKAENYISGESTRHRQMYELDFGLLKALNLNAYRFSIEWSRIEPKEGNWDAEAITYYRNYLAALKQRGIEPMVTLFHFSLPVWFTEKGGFEKRSNVKYFLRFTEKVLAEFGKDFTYIITLNEPEIYVSESYQHGHWPPGLQSRSKSHAVLRNMIYAHKKSAKLIHGTNRKYKVSIAKNSHYIYPGDDAWLTRLSTQVLQYFRDDYVLRRVRKSCDFIGVNYYFSERVYGYRVHNPHDKTSDLGWDMQPANIEFVLERLYKKYKLPLIVTENGLADANDTDRVWWLKETMVGIANALQEGVDVRGYFHWSLLDNFEWAQGKWPKFGLIEIDYKTGKRKVRASAKWWAKTLAQLHKGSK